MQLESESPTVPSSGAVAVAVRRVMNWFIATEISNAAEAACKSSAMHPQAH